MDEHSVIVSRMIAFLYPIILLVGVYVIVFGHITPGGGFQGGALLAAVFICRYLETPKEDIEVSTLLNLEKVLYVLIVALPCAYLFFRFLPIGSRSNIAYLITMNTLIGLKVCAGLAVIFYRFIFYEGGNKWRL